ncbi:hypothetical protein B0H67DRAFT_645091 [Lasiosphaeris hirsuta]|uniref:Uncharacterized protein n=1 Tax=Lasiosphaeris hirsuta TaxID=260670 RepID=A0AA40DTV5_9PEZI|nr:hypothetical protein B0H67DRAFT_645091 [Lasiosphaeris hirsuta]
MVYWKQFMGGWRRENDAIPENTTLSVTNFIKYELPEILKLRAKRWRRISGREGSEETPRQLPKGTHVHTSALMGVRDPDVFA